MKSQLKKLKSQILNTTLGQIVLKQAFRIDLSEFDEIYFHTNVENVVCKIYDLDQQVSNLRFSHEKDNYHTGVVSCLAPCLSADQFKIRKKNYGYLLLGKTPKQSTLRQKNPNPNQIVKLCKQMLEAIVQLKKSQMVMVNIRPQNVFLDTDNNYSIIQPCYISKQGPRNNMSGPMQFILDNIQKQFKYYSPQLLDSYINIPIDYKSDMFVLGCILYECITGVYPFQSRLAAINLKFSVENDKRFDNTVGKIVISMLQNYKRRPEPQSLLKIVKTISISQQFSPNYDEQQDQQFAQHNNQQSSMDDSIVIQRVQQSSGGIFDGIKSVFKKFTTETQGWYLSYTENDTKQPESKFLDLVLTKLHKKSNKFEKLLAAIKSNLGNLGNSALFSVLKNLLFIGHIIRKGPEQTFRYSAQLKQIAIFASQLAANNVLVTQLSKIVALKLQLHQKIGKAWMGNFAIEDAIKFRQVQLSSFQLLADYLKTLVLSLSSIVKKQLDLMKPVINLYCDEIYDLLSILIISIISIKKDNQLNLRKDQLKLLNPIQNILNGMLRKVSSLSNFVSAHAIYSVQIDYSFYRQEVQLRENPNYSTYQHFYRSARYYKGLTLPINFPFAYSSGTQIAKPFYNSNDSNDPTTANNVSFNQKNQPFFGDELSDNQLEPQSISKKVIHSDIRDKKKLQKVKSVDSNNKIEDLPESKSKIEDKFNELFNNNFVPSKNINKQSLIKPKPKEDQPQKRSYKLPQPLKSNKKDVTKSQLSFFDAFLNIGQVQSAQKPIKNQAVKVQPSIKKNQVKKQVNFDDFGNFGFSQVNRSSLPVKNSLNNNSSKAIVHKQTQNNEKIYQDKHKKSNSTMVQSQIKTSKKIQQPANYNNQVSSNSNNQVSLNKSSQNNFSVFSIFGKEPECAQRKINKQMNPQDIQWMLKRDSNFQFPPSLDTINLNISHQLKVQSPMMKQIQEGLRLQQLKNLIGKNPQFIVEFKDLVFEKTIGSGSAGQVFLGKYKNQVLAIKKVKTESNPNALKQFQRQLVTYLKIKTHPNLVSLMGLSRSQGNYFLLTQFCSAGSLFDLLHKKAHIIALNWKQRHTMALQIAKGMLALHQMNPVIIHRDLKSLNVFVSQQNGGYVMKVADFGLSRSPQAEMMTSALGTLHWMAPQLLENQQYSLKVDVYSYGILLWQICARKTPYHTLNGPMAIMKYVTIQKKRPGIQFVSKDCPSGLVMLMQRCWAHQSHQRPTFKEIISALQSIVV